MTSFDESLATVRQTIDGLDGQIIELIAQRQAQVIRAGELKRGRGEDAVRAPARVDDVIRKVRALATTASASPDVVEATYRAMISAFITLELETHMSKPGS
ncbi:chorismate mutase [Kribbella sp. NPDC050459]|uniref:chorismate mutase n=1 Tax=Kribbella sp. NPDC050459 TaxID=3155785 RepID=UPI0033FC3F02